LKLAPSEISANIMNITKNKQCSGERFIEIGLKMGKRGLLKYFIVHV
jgi:hypothetical protein